MKHEKRIAAMARHASLPNQLGVRKGARTGQNYFSAKNTISLLFTVIISCRSVQSIQSKSIGKEITCTKSFFHSHDSVDPQNNILIGLYTSLTKADCKM